jgi:hypothetical protein
VVIQGLLGVFFLLPVRWLSRWSDMIDDAWDQTDPYLD